MGRESEGRVINRDRLVNELTAAGIPRAWFCADGPEEGRVRLPDGTLRLPDGSASHESGGAPDTAKVSTVNAVLAAHNPAESPAQVAARRRRLADVALAAVLVETRGGAAAPAWCHTVVNALAARVGEGA